ncbi:adenylate kinase, chloroplastic isoform X2 [Carya illinoinensis]|uniref:adenylate kinase, chloroplastic isoform X2 n=1 Tax=Carya illinoinensis TaxID=32201 RepID=UPI001C724F37|nr:adenylate kinase, chloroplastic isoform X2 [Carya illinoinensis]
MACIVNFSATTQPNPQPCFASLPASTSSHRSKSPKLQSSHLSFASNNSRLSLRYDRTLAVSPPRETLLSKAPNFMIVAAANKPEPLKIMISGAPASGKGTQCELITQKYGLVHVAAGDLLRAEVAAGSENGRRAKQFMEKGQLVPDEIVVMERLLQPDAHENGWLLDGYPRSLSQATALKEFGFEPDLFILLDVAEDTLVERVVGRRLDPVTGKIYHLKYSPPETEEIAARLTQRFDDTEEKVKLRLRTHHQNVEAVLSMYKDITVKVNGNLSKNDVFAKIDSVLDELLEQRKAGSGSLAANKA